MNWKQSTFLERIETLNVFGNGQEHILKFQEEWVFFLIMMNLIVLEIKNQALGLFCASDNYKLILQAHFVSNGVSKTMTLRNASIDTTDHGAWRRRHGQKVIL